MTAAPDTRDDPYAQLPALYDLEHADVTEDIDLYLRLAEVVGDPILELGAGTGRVVIPMAGAGFRVTGLDRSRPMLERAFAAAERADVADRVTLVETAMTEAAGVRGGPFGLVIISLNGLMHVASAAEQRAVLIAARRALDPRGMLVLDLLNPHPELLCAFDGRVLHEGTWEREDGTRIDRFSARTHAPAEQRIDTTLWYDLLAADASVNRVRSQFPMRYVVRSELELLLEVAGFVEWQVYGSYDLDPYEDASDRLIVTAEVTPS